jgi:hypothetical protein
MATTDAKAFVDTNVLLRSVHITMSFLNIVATMLAYEIDTLLTQNVADMQRFDSRIKIIPLAETST